MPSTLPWPRRPPRAGGDVAGDPSSTPV
jgi:hypothetical protein